MEEVKPKIEEKELNFTIPLALHAAIKAEADRQGQTVAALIRYVLNDWAGELFAKQVEKREKDGNRRESPITQ